MHPVESVFRRMRRYPLGRHLFTLAVCFRAPYFFSIRPLIRELGPTRAEISVRKRRRVTNHIGTVHAIAMANACELAAGTLLEVGTPRDMRWIPRGMEIEYRRKATTDIRAVAWLDERIATGAARDVVVPVDVMDANGEIVVHARIAMYVSPRPRA